MATTTFLTMSDSTVTLIISSEARRLQNYKMADSTNFGSHLEFPVKIASEVVMCTGEKYVPENVEVAAGILFYLVPVRSYNYSRFRGRHFEFISNVRQQYVSVPVPARHFLLQT